MTSKYDTPYKFIKPNWLDIPALFKYISTLNLGQQHAFIVYVEKIYNEDWWQTITFNCTKNLNHYRDLCKKLKIKTNMPPFDRTMRNKKFSGTSRHRMVTQGLGDLMEGIKDIGVLSREAKSIVTETSARVNSVAEEVRCAVTKAEKLIDQAANTSTQYHVAGVKLEQTLTNADNLITQFNSLVAELVSKFKAISVGSVLPTLLTVIAKFFALGYLLMQKCNQNVTNIIAILTLIVPVNWTGLHSIANDLIRAIQRLMGKFVAQDSENNTNIIVGFFELIKGILQGIFGTLHDDQFKSMTLSSNRLRVVSDTIRSASTILEFISKMTMKIIEIIGDKCLTYFGWLPWFAKDRSLEPLIDEYEKIKLERIEDRCQVSKYAARRILELHDALLTYEAKLHKRFAKGSNEMRSLTPYLRLMIKNLSEIIARIPDHFKSGKNPRRVKPFWVYIFGDPRIGKSALLQPYIVNALVKSLGLIDKYEDYTNYTYFRNCGEEYWEGYYGQSVLWYNDLFQNHADDQAMHKAVMELTNVVDDNLFPLNMAFERKHGVYFDSELVVSNAQDDIILANFIRNKCWSGGSHLFARRNVVLQLTLNTKYEHPSGVGYCNQKVQDEMKAHPDQCFGKKNALFPSDMYIINVIDNLDGHTIMSLNFEQTITYLQGQAADFKERQNVFKDKLYDEFRALWAQSCDEVLNIPLLNERMKNCLLGEKIMSCDEYIAQLQQGIPLAKFQNLYVDLTKIDLIDPHNADSDVTQILWKISGFNIDALFKLLEKSVVASDNGQSLIVVQKTSTHLTTMEGAYNAVSPQKGPLINQQTEDCEPVYYDALDLEREAMITATEDVANAIREMFPDILQYGWEEGVADFQRDKVVVPDVLKTKFNPGATVIGDNVKFTRVFQGFNASTEKKMRVILTVEAVGYKIYDDMNYRKIRTFCQHARAVLSKYTYRVFNAIVSNEFFQSIMTGILVGTSVIVISNLMSMFVGYVMDRCGVPSFVKGDTQSLQKYKKIIDEELARRQEQPIASQTAEGNLKGKQVQVKRVLKKNVKAQAYDTQNQVVENIIKNHICKFSTHVVHNGEIQDERMYGSALCVGADIFALPDHFTVRWTQLRNLYSSKGDQFVLNLHWSAEQKVPIDWESVQFYKLPYEHSDDLCFMRIKNLVQMRQIHKFFHRVTDNPSLFDSYLFGKRAGDFTVGVSSVHRTEMARQIYEHPERLDAIYGSVLEGRMIEIPLCFRYYDAKTINGDCGMLLLTTDSRMNCRKILGMHTAGGTEAGVSSIIYQEDIEEAFKYFNDSYMVVEIQDDLKPVEDSVRAQELEALGLRVAGELGDISIPGYPIKVRPKICLPRKSNVHKSLVHDIMCEDFGPTTVAPARLRPFKRGDEIVSPLDIGLRKLTKVSPMVPLSVCEKVTNHMYQSIKSWHSPYQEPRLLTDDEVVNGFGLLNPVEMKTSPGYPYVLLDNTNGKIPFFVQRRDKTWEMGPLVRQRYMEREEMARNAQIPPTYFIATLKDETRPLEKVQAGKTRIFQISPMDFNLLLRKYFGYFIAHCHATYLNGEMAVGINANSYEWTLFIKHMLEVGSLFVNGDGENFDASAGQNYSMANVEVINRWYNDGEVNYRIRRILYITFLNAKNIIGRLVVVLFQGNQSGIYITTIFNNMTGMFAVRYTFIRCGYDLNLFHSFIRNKDYGDDDLICVSTMADRFNFFSHQQTLALMGIVYTTAQKKEVDKPHFNINEITFLKRRFVKHEGVYLPQMPLEVILEIPRWAESDPTKMFDQMNRFNASLLEMSNYGREEYNKLYQHYEEYCFILQQYGHSICPTELFEYDRCYNIKFSQLVGVPLLPVVDRVSLAPTREIMRQMGGSGSETLGKIDEQDCCVLISYKPASNFETQTSEGSAKPPVKNIVRIIKTQSSESENIIQQDFQCEMFLMEKIREMAPIMQSVYDYASSQLHRSSMRTAARRLCRSVRLLYQVYENCANAFSSIEPLVAQSGDEHNKANERERPTSIEEGVEKISIGPTEHDEDVVKEKATIFINENTPHQPIHRCLQVRRDWNSVRDVNLEQFYNRAIILEEFQWIAENDLKLLRTINLPSALYSNVALGKKLANIAFARPDIEIEVMVNSTTFHYGTLTCAVVPYPERCSNAFKQVYSCTTWPQWYDIPAGAQQSVKFVVPFRSFYNVSRIPGGPSDWAALMFYITVPLCSATSTKPAAVGVTVVARMLRPQFSGLTTQGEQESLTTKAIVGNSGNLGTVSTAAYGVARVAQSIGKLSGDLGFAVPPNLAATMPMQIRSPLLCRSEDLPATIVLGPAQNAAINRDFSAVNADVDEMEFSHFINHPSQIDRILWTSGSSSGTALWTAKIDSNLFVNNQIKVDGVQYPTPLGYLLNAHCFWRGSIKVCIRVVASAFHTGRLRLVYTPTWQLDGTVNTVTSSNAKNVTIDVNGLSDTVVEIPYDTEKPWMSCNGADIAGYLHLIVINPLSTGNTETPMNAYIKIFAWGGPDFQLSLPKKSKVIPDLQYVTKPAAVDAVMSAQGEERSTKPCQLAASSADCLRETKAIWLGDTDRRQLLGRETTSYTYTSIKQAVNMLTPIARYITAKTDKLSSYIVDPLYGIQAEAYDGQTWNCQLMYYRPIYNFGRGAFRVVAVMSEEIRCTVGVAQTNFFGPATAINSLKDNPFNWLWPGSDDAYGDLFYAGSSAAYFTNSAFQPVDVTVPYFASVECFLMGSGKYSIAANGNYETQPTGLDHATRTSSWVWSNACFVFSNQETEKAIVFFVAGGDDLMFGCRKAIPRCLTKKPAEVLRLTNVQDSRPQTPSVIQPKPGAKMTLIDIVTKDGTKIFSAEDNDYVKPAPGMIVEYLADFTKTPVDYGRMPPDLKKKVDAKVRGRAKRALFYTTTDDDENSLDELVG